MVRTAFLLRCSLATTATTAVILFKSKTYNLGKGYSTKKSENTGIAKKGGVLTLPRFFCGFDSLKISRMPGRGRPQSFWWTHFEMVEGDFRLVRCLHCQKQVRRGKIFVELSFTNYTCQDTTDTVSSVIEKYLQAPLEELKCLRCFDN
jgi:hypothetical protein